MKIEKITLSNFRQFYGCNNIELRTSDHNIVLICGKNGYGKTNLLIALVWCLYGEKIDKVDVGFKREIRKAGNYSKFLKNSINWKSLEEGNTKLSVEISFNDIDLPEKFMQSIKPSKCLIQRSFDLNNMEDSLEIFIPGISENIFNDEEDKTNFINDHIIPVEVAKFIFFDAEKISEMADLSVQEEGNIMNDALGKMLGLDLYENLLDDLRTYSDNLKRDSADFIIKDQIASTENAIKVNSITIEECELKISRIEDTIRELRLKISQYESFLLSNGNQSEIHTKNFFKKREECYQLEQELKVKFMELSETIPFAMVAETLEDIVEHTNKQNETNSMSSGKKEVEEKSDSFIEDLFNRPPFPQNNDIMFFQKIFYAEKAKKLFNSIFDSDPEIPRLPFEHDLSPTDIKHIKNVFEYTKHNSNNEFQNIASQLNSVQNEINQITKLIRIADTNSENIEVIEYKIKKNEASSKLEKLLEEKGSLIEKKNECKKEIEGLNQKYQMFLRKVEISEQKRRKFEKVNIYIKTMDEFITSQKQKKKSSLGKNILEEMRKLMHKLQDSNDKFIADVRVEILPEKDGLTITLFDADGNIKPKEALSQGEKQIYVSALIKAVLAESIQDYPIIIDTPLGRLDDGHIKNALMYYYPDLSKQVILMATNNEISYPRYNLIKDIVSETYLLESLDNNTIIKKGVYNYYEN